MIKEIKTEKYMIKFDQESGIEIMTGINNYSDPFVLEFPSLLDIGVMGHCKNQCKFCYQGKFSQKNMTLGNYIFIIDKVKKYVNQIALGGRGDPNDHEDFEKILKYARDNGIVPNYTTSGINLTDRQIYLTKKYCGAVAVSDYRKDFTFNAINRFTESGCKTNIHYLFTRHTANEAFKILDGEDIWEGKINLSKLNGIIFLLFKKQGRAKNLQWNPSDEQIKTFSEKIKKLRTKFKIGVDSCLCCKMDKLVGFSELEKLYTDTCEAARMSAYISPDMRLVPCSFVNLVPKQNNILINDIFDIWENSEQFISVRDKLRNHPNICPLNL